MVRSLSFAFTLSAVVITCGISYAGDNDDRISRFPVLQGFAISPVKLNFAGKDLGKVGLGSYLVNGIGDCSGCHSFPQYLEKGNMAGNNPAAGDPYEGTPSTQSVSRQLVANFNTSHYLAGGQCFGPFMARNLTPESNGQPEGLTEAEFIKVMRTGEDIHCEKEPADPICALGPPTDVLQVMPWPTYHSMTDADLKAIYAYLTAIPPASACNTVADGLLSRVSGSTETLSDAPAKAVTEDRLGRVAFAEVLAERIRRLREIGSSSPLVVHPEPRGARAGLRRCLRARQATAQPEKYVRGRSFSPPPLGNTRELTASDHRPGSLVNRRGRVQS